MQDEQLEAVRMLEETGAEFLALAQDLTDALWNQRPALGGWSLVDVAEHVALVEASCAKLLARRLFTERASEELLLVTKGRDATLVRWLESEEKRTAPDFVKPAGKWKDGLEVVQAFEEHRKTNVASYRSSPAELRAYGFSHPILGPLDGFQWAVFLSLHLRRHIRQMRRIRSDLTAAETEKATGSRP